MTDIFEIIGPVMIGPSSSHTAGAVRLGLISRMALGEEIKSANIILYGSFARTGQGHGTDKAIVAGLLGFACDDTRVRESRKIAEEKGIQIKISTAIDEDLHPNTARIQLTGTSGKTVEILGCSIGGGRVRVTAINGANVEFTGEYHTLVINQKDFPGVVAEVAGVLAQNKINIAYMRVYRNERHGEAVTVIESDEAVDDAITGKLKTLQNISDVMHITPV